MATSLEELKILQVAEHVADELWKQIVAWDVFARDVEGSQLTRASDSVGANIAESFGRFNYGEKVQFLYYARGSLFETKYWLNRSIVRHLISSEIAQAYSERLTDLARQLNAFVSSLKSQRQDGISGKRQRRVQEVGTSYMATDSKYQPNELFTETDLLWLTTLPDVNL